MSPLLSYRPCQNLQNLDPISPILLKRDIWISRLPRNLLRRKLGKLLMATLPQSENPKRCQQSDASKAKHARHRLAWHSSALLPSSSRISFVRPDDVLCQKAARRHHPGDENSSTSCPHRITRSKSSLENFIPTQN